MKDIFKPENKRLDEVETLICGKYKLVVTPYKVGKGYWDYTEGVVYNQQNEIIATIQRNYSSFWYCFIEDHIDGHDYLLCGADYQGQTVIQLDTGQRVDYIPKAAKHGMGFCWIETKQISPTNILVTGCYWAFPTETLVVDFTNPMVLPYPIIERWLEDEEE